MIEDNEAISVEEEAPVASKRFPLVGFLAAVIVLLLGVLGLVSVSGYSLYKKNTLLQAETRAARADLKRKTVALEEMEAQIEGLSGQMRALKEHAEARSRKADAAAEDTVAPSPAKNSTDVALPVQPSAKEKTIASGARSSAVPQKAEASPGTKAGEEIAQDCNLIGKTDAEREATLKRCVSVMESVSAKPGSGRAAGVGSKR